MTNPLTTDPSSEPQSPAQSPAATKSSRRTFIACLIGLSSLLFIATAILLYLRWATMREPSCVLVIEAAPPLKGAEVLVDSVMFAQPLKSTIGENSRYMVGMFTVMDCTQHQSKKDPSKIYQYGIKLFPAKFKVLNTLQRKRQAHVSLVHLKCAVVKAGEK